MCGVKGRWLFTSVVLGIMGVPVAGCSIMVLMNGKGWVYTCSLMGLVKAVGGVRGTYVDGVLGV